MSKIQLVSSSGPEINTLLFFGDSNVLIQFFFSYFPIRINRRCLHSDYDFQCRAKFATNTWSFARNHDEALLISTGYDAKFGAAIAKCQHKRVETIR